MTDDVNAGRSPKNYDNSTTGAALDARLLRGLGEKADSMRGEDLALVKIDDGGVLRYDIVRYAEAEQMEAANSATIVERVNTPSDLAARNWMTVTVDTATGSMSTRSIDGVDAAFWSESALEKFLWPYYEGMRIWDPEYAERLKQALRTDPSIVGVIHVGESSSQFVRDGGGSARLVVQGPTLMGPRVMTLEDYLAEREAVTEH